MIKSKYPNYECGECPAWLAINGDNVSFKEIIETYCCKCEIYLEEAYECDGRCLNCDEFDPFLGYCEKEKE